MAEDVNQAYDEWRAAGSPESMDEVIRHLEPRINANLSRFGLADDNLARVKAKVYVAQAVKTYNPDTGAGLPTWADRNLMQLTRFKRLRATPVKVPEGVQLDQYAITKAEREFEEKHGRMPELDELADAAKIPVKRIASVRKTFKPMASEGAFQGHIEGQLGADMDLEALDAVWRDSDKLDRRIIELRTGFGRGGEPLPAKDVAVALGLTPVQLSRRAARIAARIDEMLEVMER